MFRVGSKNGHTVYWTDDTSSTAPDRFAFAALTPAAAEAAAEALNHAYQGWVPEWVRGLPEVPRREAT